MLMTSVLHGPALLVAWTGCPPSLHGPALLLFLEETFLHTLCIDDVMSSSQGKERFVLPSIRETAKNTRFQFLMCYLLISMHCITCYMALDSLSCCKCLLVYVTLFRGCRRQPLYCFRFDILLYGFVSHFRWYICRYVYIIR